MFIAFLLGAMFGGFVSFSVMALLQVAADHH